MKTDHRKRFLFLSFIIPVLFLLIWFIWRHIAPFGENSFLIHDMNAQYVDFFAYLRTVLSGKNDTSYILSRELGGDFRSFFSYYLISPFNLIVILAPESMVPAAISLEIMLLFGLAGLSCFSCLDEYTGGEKPYFLLYLSAAYSLSAWMLLNAENFQFIPEAVIFPMIMAALRKFKHEGKVLPLAIWLIAGIALNFYLGYMICIFVFLWTVVPDGKRFDFRIVLIFIAVIVCSAPVWLPAARMLGTTIKQTDPFWYQPRLNMSVKEFVWKLLPGSFDYKQYQDQGLPAVYCGLITLAGLLYYFICSEMTDLKRHRLIILLILLVSFFFRPLTMIWQGFSEPHWWPYRFSFLFIFVLVLCAAESGLHVNVLILLLGLCGLFYNMDKTFSVKLWDCVSSSKYTESVMKKKDFISSINDSDDGIFRIGDGSPRSDNDAMHFSYMGITGFDSLADRSVMEFLKRIGYDQDRYTVSYGRGNTLFANDLLGVRYRISGDEVMRSEIPAGLAFIVEKDLSENMPETEDAVQFQNFLAEDLGASSPLLSEISEIESVYDNFECDQEFCWTVSVDGFGSITYSFHSDKAGFLYAHTDNLPVVGEMELIRGENKVSLRSTDYFLPLGEIKAEETVSVELKINSPISDIPYVGFIIEDSSAVSDLFTPLFRDIRTEKISSSKLIITVPPEDKVRTMVITLPYDKKWKAASGDSELLTERVWGLFLGIQIPEGVSEVVLQYH